MTTIINRYVGITHPVTSEGIHKDQFLMLLKAWKISNCPQGIHLFDEVWSGEHYLHCDACGLEVHIEKVVVPDGKDVIIDNSNAKRIKKK